MPLRFRLICLVFLALLASLALGGAVTLFNASHSVRTEMRSALLVGRQTVDKFVGEIEGSPDPQRHLDDLVASFKGSRHLRIRVTGNTAPGAVPPVADRSPFGDVPAWFVRVIGVMPDTEQVLIRIGGRPFAAVVITTDPRDEILEVWDGMAGSLLVLALFGGTTIPLIFLFIGRALRPLDRLTAAMEQVGQGDYSVRVFDRLTPELARLRDSFNRMAACLAATDADNRRLNEQLLTLQEEERSDIARDLHDEIGPFLFAINVDVANVSRLLQEQRVAELPGHIQSIAAASRHLQGQVRSMLGRLRPIALAEFGLAEALRSLVEFWRRRYPDIDYQVEVSQHCEKLGNLIDTTVYRIVQECLSNAVRHGNPGRIEISVSRASSGDARRDDAIIKVIDDGQGMSEAPGIGYGLIGMEERVRAMGGRFGFSNRPGGGFAVSAVLPCLGSQELPLAAMPERA